MTLDTLYAIWSQITWLDRCFFMLQFMPILNLFLILGLYLKKRPMQISGSGGGIYAHKLVTKKNPK